MYLAESQLLRMPTTSQPQIVKLHTLANHQTGIVLSLADDVRSGVAVVRIIAWRHFSARLLGLLSLHLAAKSALRLSDPFLAFP